MSLTDQINVVTDARLNRRLEPLEFTVASRADYTRLKEIWAERPMVPVLVRERSEGTDVSFGGRDARIYLTGDDSAGRYCVEDVIYAPGWDFPAYHMDEAEQYWYVVDGEVEITVGNRTETCAAGANAFIPRNTTCALRNRTDSPARLFQWSSPAGFDHALQEIALTHAGTELDILAVAEVFARYAVVVHQQDVSLPNDCRVNEKPEPLEFNSDSLESFLRFRELLAARPMIPKLLLKSSDAPPIEGANNKDSYCVLTGDESAGRAMTMVHDLPPGLFVPPHYQPTEEELFYAVDDGLWWRVGTEETTTETGSFAFAPRHGTHQFGNPTDGIARFITVNSPAGHERALAHLHEIDLSRANEHEEFFTKWGWQIKFQ